MDLKKFFHIFILSFYSPSLYIQIAHKWRHWGLNYLLKLSILVTLVSTITISAITLSFNFNNPTIINLLDQIPEIDIKNNQAQFVNEGIRSPVRIKLENSSKDIIIIDLAISSAESYNQEAIIFTNDRIAFNFQGSSLEIFYPDLLNSTGIDKLKTDTLLDLLNQSKKKILSVLLLLGIPLGSLVCFAFIFIKATFYSSIASILLRFTKGKLNFKQLTRIAIISITPSLVISTIMSLFFIHLSLNPVVQNIISYIYIFYFVYTVTLCNRHGKKDIFS